MVSLGCDCRRDSDGRPLLRTDVGPRADGLASHGAEVQEIFGVTSTAFPYSEQLSVAIQEYWGTFAVRPSTPLHASSCSLVSALTSKCVACAV